MSRKHTHAGFMYVNVFRGGEPGSTGLHRNVVGAGASQTNDNMGTSLAEPRLTPTGCVEGQE